MREKHKGRPALQKAPGQRPRHPGLPAPPETSGLTDGAWNLEEQMEQLTAVGRDILGF